MLLNICQDAGVLQTIYIIKLVLKVIFILVPVIVIITGIISMASAVINGNDSDIKNNASLLLVKFIVGAIIFFVPTIVNALFSVVNDAGLQSKYSSCITNATLDKINYYKDLKKKELENDLKAEQEEINNSQNNGNSNNNASQGSNQGNSSSNNSNQNNSNAANNGTPEAAISKTMFIGDSRTVGMYFSLYSDSYSNTINKSVNNELWYASVGKGYSWFSSTAMPYIKSKLSAANYNVVIIMGANDLYNSNIASNYVEQIKSLSELYPNSKYIMVSVNPIEDNKSKSNGYSVTNSQVIAFNKKLKSATANSNASYCDTYSSISQNFSTTDGLHYASSTSKQIYSLINNCF